MSLAPSVLVTSVGSGVGYGVLHAFRRAARRYRVIGANCEAVAAGNFRCDRLHLMPPTSDADAYLEALDRVLARERPELLVPGHDSELPLLAGHRHALEQRHGCRVVVASSEVIRVSNDKLESARFFGECFAATVAADDADGIERLIAERGFPLLVKPRFGYASRGVRLAFDRAGLEAALTAATGPAIVQEYLAPAGMATRAGAMDGDRLRQDNEYSAQVVVGSAGRPLGLFLSRNTLWHGLPFTVETLRQPALESVVLAMTARLAGLGLIGPCNFQARETRDGGYAFFEINARFTGITPVRADMDFNECDAVHRHFVDGEPAPPLRCEPGRWARRYLSHDLFDARDLAILEQTGTWPAST